jgi:hypothetical protein
VLPIIVVILLIKCDLGRLGVHVDILEESAVHVVSLLLNGGTELEEIFRHGLVGTSENVDEPEYVSMDLSQRVCELTSRSATCPRQ